MTEFLETLQPWHLWAALALVLFAAEMLTLSFYLFCFAVAAVGASVAAGMGATTTGQLAIFAATAILAILSLRRLFRRIIYRNSEVKPTLTSAMTGTVGIVTETITGSTTAGRVKLRGEEWRALAADNTTIAEGQSVEVVTVTGATITVKAV